MCKLGVISQERLKIEVKLGSLLSSNRKSYMPCRLAQQRMTLSDLEWSFHVIHIERYLCSSWASCYIWFMPVNDMTPSCWLSHERMLCPPLQYNIWLHTLPGTSLFVFPAHFKNYSSLIGHIKTKFMHGQEWINGIAYFKVRRKTTELSLPRRTKEPKRISRWEKDGLRHARRGETGSRSDAGSWFQRWG